MSRTLASLAGAAASAALLLANPAQAAGAAPAPAGPTQADDMAALKQQLNDLRRDYDARIQALETRLQAAEEHAAAAPVVTAPPSAAPTQTAEAAPGEVVIPDTTPEPVVKTASANAANPGVSVVLNGNYVATSHNPAGARISGYPLDGEAGPFARGFSLGESEVTLAANVDPFLTANLTASFSRDDQVSVEEAYIQSTALPGGITLKAGRFFSAIGYLNERHAHNWSFIDMPLPYRALLGVQYGDDGVQARWLAPTPFFLEVGGELFRGDHFPAGDQSKNRPGASTLFVHTGSDINDESSWLGALSYIHTQAHDRITDTDAGSDLFNGHSDLGIASLVYKWAPGGNPSERNLTLSGEYFFGQERGDFNAVPVNRDPRGWYAQGVYQFRKGWSAGVRYAELRDLNAPLPLAGTTVDSLNHTPRAFSALLEFDSSEFGRFRAQYTRDNADRRSNDELLLQYTIVYGPHGAHRY